MGHFPVKLLYHHAEGTLLFLRLYQVVGELLLLHHLRLHLGMRRLLDGKATVLTLQLQLQWLHILEIGDLSVPLNDQPNYGGAHLKLRRNNLKKESVIKFLSMKNSKERSKE